MFLLFGLLIDMVIFAIIRLFLSPSLAWLVALILLFICYLKG